MITIGFGFFLFVVFFLLFRKKRINKKISAYRKKQGDIGEIKVAKLITSLGGQVIRDVYVQSGKGVVRQIDLICLINNILLIVECKNWKGDLEYWGNTISATMPNGKGIEYPNPEKQVKGQAFTLASYLKSKGCNIWVDSFVVIINDKMPDVMGDNIFRLNAFQSLLKNMKKGNGDARRAFQICESLHASKIQRTLMKEHSKRY